MNSTAAAVPEAPNPQTNFRGVVWNRGKWLAAVRCDGTWHNLGRHKSEVEAAKAYDTAARELHGSSARLNFPQVGERDRRGAVTLAPSDPEPWIDPCPGCGVDTCDDWGLCDVDLSTVIPSQGHSEVEAIKEIEEAWGCTLDGMMDGDICADITTATEAGGAYVAHTPIVEAVKAGYTLAEIARATGLPVEMIVRNFTQAGATGTTPEVFDEVLARLRAREQSWVSIGRDVGMAPATVCRLANDLGFEPLARGKTHVRIFSDEQIAEAYRLRDEGLSLSQVAVAMGLRDKDQASSLLRRNARPVEVAA